jgi:predicted amidohydrolase YtcJ
VLIKNATIWPGREAQDIRFSVDGIEAISELLTPNEGEAILDAQGAIVLPGLHDHHIHLNSYAASISSLSCEPLADGQAFENLLRSQEDSETAPELRIIHYHEGIAGDLDRFYLDRLLPKRAARVQHKTGRLWVFNSAGLRAFGLDPDLPANRQHIITPVGLEHQDGVLTGRLYDEDNWLQKRRRALPPDLTEASLRLASFGVTGATDTTPSNGLAEWNIFRRAQNEGALKQRVRVMGRLELAQLETSDKITLGEHKIHLLESELPLLETVVEQIRCAHKSGRSVAVHCATRVELIFTLGAFESAGARAGDRIEHNSVCGDHELSIIRDLGLRVVTQPHFIQQRGDHYLTDVEPHDVPDLYRLASVERAGIPLAFGSDAPFGDANPWRAIWAANTRRTQAGRIVGEQEAVSVEKALEGFLYRADQPGAELSKVAVGEPADLVLLKAPWPVIAAKRDLNPVARTWIGGQEIYRAPSISRTI